MSGHSKWSTIKHKKEKTDAQRAKIFTKIGREMAVVIKEGGADPNTNNKLRDLIAKAKANNVPNDNIERAIKKASGEDNKNTYEHITYEGYGPNGIAVMVQTLTDNRNRTASDVRHLFDKYGGNLGATGCVSYMFDQKGIIVIEKTLFLEEELMETALEVGASDFRVEDDIYEIETEPKEFSSVRTALEEKGVSFLSAEIEFVPQNYTTIVDKDLKEKFELMIEKLEENDDVTEVWHNFETV